MGIGGEGSRRQQLQCFGIKIEGLQYSPCCPCSGWGDLGAEVRSRVLGMRCKGGSEGRAGCARGQQGAKEGRGGCSEHWDPHILGGRCDLPSQALE